MFHSRTIDKRMAAAKQAKIRRWFSIVLLSPRGSSKRREIENRELLSKPHDVVAAVHVDHFAGDAAAGVGGEEDTG